jgi:hypothetical protein
VTTRRLFPYWPMSRTAHIPDAALDADIAILGKKGRGKTFTAKGIVERLLHMQRRVLVLDPLSVWWGLKSGPDGKAPGFPIPVFGGPHADIPLHEAAGLIIGELIVSSGMGCGFSRDGIMENLSKFVFHPVIAQSQKPVYDASSYWSRSPESRQVTRGLVGFLPRMARILELLLKSTSFLG